MSTLPKSGNGAIDMIFRSVSWGFQMTLATFSWIGRIFSHLKVSVQKSWSEKQKNDQAQWLSWQSWTVFALMVIGRWIISPFRAFNKTVPTWPPKPPAKKKK